MDSSGLKTDGTILLQRKMADSSLTLITVRISSHKCAVILIGVNKYCGVHHYQLYYLERMTHCGAPLINMKNK